MAKNMTLSGYLAQRGTKAKALTRGEAALLGIPYPLQAGWPRRYGAVEIDEAMLEQLAACAEVARRAVDEKVQRALSKPSSASEMPEQLKLVPIARAIARTSTGFILRRARRYR